MAAVIYILVICMQLPNGAWSCRPAGWSGGDKTFCEQLAKQSNMGMGPGMQYHCATQEVWRFTD